MRVQLYSSKFYFGTALMSRIQPSLEVLIERSGHFLQIQKNLPRLLNAAIIQIQPEKDSLKRRRDCAA